MTATETFEPVSATPPRRVSRASRVPGGHPWVLVAGIVATLYFARQVLIPFAVALTLTFILAPIVRWVQRSHLGRVPAVLIVVIGSVAAAGALGWAVGGQLLSVFDDLPKYRDNIHTKLETLRNPRRSTLGRITENVKDITRELSTPDTPANVLAPESARPAAVEPRNKVTPVRIVDPPNTGWDSVLSFVSPLLLPVGAAAVVLIFTIFMLIRQEDLRNRFLRLAGVRQLHTMTVALDDAASRVSRYLFLQSIVNIGFGTCFGIGLYFIHVPNAALWGVIAGILRIVPYVGGLAAAAMPITLALAVFNGWWPPVLVFLLYAVLEVVIANFIEPWLYGAHTGISPLAILVTTAFWAMLWGPVGLILSTPLTVCLVVLGRHITQLSFLHILLGDEPVLGPHAQIYQRLLAMDQGEARGIADVFLKDQPLVGLYDSVLIPALTLAEQDRHKGALDEAREEFLFLNINEMIAELAGSIEDSPAEPPSFHGRVFCLPAHDEADRISATMLTQLVEQLGYWAVSLPPGALLREMQAMEPEPGDIVCICAVPPFSFAYSKAVCKEVRSRFPKLRTVVAIWGFTGDIDNAMARFERQKPDAILTSLADALTYVAR